MNSQVQFLTETNIKWFLLICSSCGGQSWQSQPFGRGFDGEIYHLDIIKIIFMYVLNPLRLTFLQILNSLSWYSGSASDYLNLLLEGNDKYSVKLIEVRRNYIFVHEDICICQNVCLSWRMHPLWILNTMLLLVQQIVIFCCAMLMVPCTVCTNQFSIQTLIVNHKETVMQPFLKSQNIIIVLKGI